MGQLLGDRKIELFFFDGMAALFKKWGRSKDKSPLKKMEKIHQALFDYIQGTKEPCFLLPAVLDFIRQVNDQVLSGYTFSSFELWLNQKSGLSFEENYAIRAKIAGKRIERGDYQVLFPIGMGKVYEGTHFVTAHKSPDLDTTIASFWGWLDAFAARVGDGLHVWNLPEGPPSSQIEIEWMFRDLFGEAVFTHLPKTRPFLHVSAKDLITQKGMHCVLSDQGIGSIDHREQGNAVLVVDEEGFFLGDWKENDVEGVRQVILCVESCLRWFQHYLHVELIGAFAKKRLTLDELRVLLKKGLSSRVGDCEPALQWSASLRYHVDLFLKKGIDLDRGLEADFSQFAKVLSDLASLPFGGVEKFLARMKKEGLFSREEELIDDRTSLFSFLEESTRSLEEAVVQIRNRLEKLDLALKIKEKVFGRPMEFVTLRAEFEEIRDKMAGHSYLTVVYPEGQRWRALGVVQAASLRKPILGTVSLRDFCNREEMGIPPYLDVISVIDHHKSSLQTSMPLTAILSDAQSSNTLVAMQAFAIADAPHLKPSYIHPERAYIEYLHFLYGILDDTDLLSKVSPLDVLCVASLLNRLKSLAIGKKKEVIRLDDLPRDRFFAKKAADRILQNDDMYSLYQKVYLHREKEIDENLSLAAKGKNSTLFADTKEQNGCCRIGQTKLFLANFRQFFKQADAIRDLWLEKAQCIEQEKKEIDLHLHMISTIISADEVYEGKKESYSHQDELWIWVAHTEIAEEHLRQFLNAFQTSSGLKQGNLSLELRGEHAHSLAAIFKESFLPIETTIDPSPKKSVAILRCAAGAINSRKAMVSPFLPKRG